MARFKLSVYLATVVVVLSYFGSVGIISNMVTSQSSMCITVADGPVCKKNGSCVTTNSGGWYCLCPSNYSGVYCENTATYLSFEDLNYSRLETSDKINLIVQRRGHLDKKTTVRVETFDDTARSGTHYQGLSTVLTFNPSVASLTVHVNLMYSGAAENVNFWVVLSNATNGAVQSPNGSAVVHVLDTDSETAQVFPLIYHVIATKSNGLVEVEFLRSGAINQNVTMTVSTADELRMDTRTRGYIPFRDRVFTFMPERYSVRVRVNLTDNTIPEGSRFFNLEYNVLVGGNSSGVVKIEIQDDDDSYLNRPGDATFVFFAGTLPYLTDERSREVRIPIYRIGNLNKTTKIEINTSNGTALSGEDYQAMNEIFTIEHGIHARELCIRIVQDSMHEWTVEYFLVTLGVLDGGQLGRPQEGTVRVNIKPDPGEEQMTTVESTTGEPVPTPSSLVIPIVIGVIVGVVLIFGLILVILYFYCKRRSASRPKESGMGDIPLTNKRQLAHANSYLNRGFATPQGQGQGQGSIAPMSNVDPETKEYPRDKLRFHEEIGAGAFAVVYRAEAMGIHRPGLVSVVAVKMLKKTASETDKTDFMKELNVFKMLDRHANVMSLLGCCTTKEPFYLILDFMPHGNLQSYLQQVRTGKERDHPGYLDATQRIIQPEEVLKYSSQVARGMEYLASKECIHRDLATRNILLGEDHVCKVSDFGLARDMAGEQQYEMKSKGRVPVRWLAPECLFDNTYTSQSDMWSFGVLMWELVTQGSHPYPGMSSQHVIKQVQHGYRLPKPDCCSQEIYDLMYSCWNVDPEARPTFQSIRKSIEDMLSNAQGYLLMDCFQEEDYVYITPGQESDDEDGFNDAATARKTGAKTN